MYGKPPSLASRIRLAASACVVQRVSTSSLVLERPSLPPRDPSVLCLRNPVVGRLMSFLARHEIR